MFVTSRSEFSMGKIRLPRPPADRWTSRRAPPVGGSDRVARVAENPAKTRSSRGEFGERLRAGYPRPSMTSNSEKRLTDYADCAG